MRAVRGAHGLEALPKMSRLHHSSGGEPSQRMLRVGEVIRHTVSSLLSRGAINDPVLEGHVVTIPDVRMSPDLKLATVYVMPLGGKDMSEVLAAFDRNKKFLRGEIAHRINLKFAPDIRFRPDDSFDCGAKIDAILDSPQVKRDLIKDNEN
jgi:ribosome-binding factor A